MWIVLRFWVCCFHVFEYLNIFSICMYVKQFLGTVIQILILLRIKKYILLVAVLCIYFTVMISYKILDFLFPFVSVSYHRRSFLRVPSRRSCCTRLHRLSREGRSLLLIFFQVWRVGLRPIWSMYWKQSTWACSLFVTLYPNNIYIVCYVGCSWDHRKIDHRSEMTSNVLTFHW